MYGSKNIEAHGPKGGKMKYRFRDFKQPRDKRKGKPERSRPKHKQWQEVENDYSRG